jgi:hypothetical protein
VGSTESVLAGFDLALMATTYAAVPGGNLTGNGVSLAHHTFGLVFCGSEGDGACPQSQFHDTDPVAFSYLPVSSLNDQTYNAPPPTGPVDFSSDYPGWVTTIRNAAHESYRAAFAKLPAIVSQGWKANIINASQINASQFEHTVYVTGKWNLGGDFFNPTIGETLGHTNLRDKKSDGTYAGSNVYYWPIMGFAQGAAGDLSKPRTNYVSPVFQFPAPTNPSALAQFNTQFNQVITATGTGIGNIAAHETGWQLHVTYMGCPSQAANCPEFYMYQSTNGAATQFYGDVPGEPLTWGPEGECAIYKFLLGSVPKGYSCK